MPWIDGGTPVTMDALFTLVNEGIAPRARPRQPVTLMRCKFGIRPRARAASRYSSAEPSRQTTTTGRAGGVYMRPLATNDLVLISRIALKQSAAPPLRRWLRRGSPARGPALPAK